MEIYSWSFTIVFKGITKEINATGINTGDIKHLPSEFILSKIDDEYRPIVDNPSELISFLGDYITKHYRRMKIPPTDLLMINTDKHKFRDFTIKIDGRDKKSLYPDVLINF